MLGLRDKSLAFTVDLLGEAVISEAEADLYQQTCLDLIRGLSTALNEVPEIPLIDRDQKGPIPRVNLSLKLSSLTTHFDPIHTEVTLASVAGRLRPILRTAREMNAYVHVDMEQYFSRFLTYAIFCRVLAEPDFRDWPDVGIVVQAYQPQAEAELQNAAEVGRIARHAHHDPASQGGLLGLRGLDRAAAGLARAGLPPEVAKRRDV